MSDFFKVGIICAIAAISVVVNLFLPKKYHDSPPEEYAEYVIEQQTGIDVDLTPSSPEEEPIEAHWVDDNEDDDDWVPWEDCEWGALFDENGTATDEVHRLSDEDDYDYFNVNGISHNDAIE